MEIDNNDKSNDVTQRLLIDNFKKLLSSFVPDKKTIQRFVSEYNLINDCKIKTNNTDKKFWFLFYIVYIIGKSEYKKMNFNIMISLIEENVGKILNNEFVLNEQIIEVYRKTILNEPDYIKYINKGAELISIWE